MKLGDSNSFYDGAGGNVFNWATTYGGFTAVIDSFHNNGIKVYGWQYVYGTSKWGGGGTESGVTNQILSIPGIDGFIIDAEVEFEAAGMTAVAAQYLNSVRAAHPNSFVALTSFARVTGQPIPWTTFLSQCDAFLQRGDHGVEGSVLPYLPNPHPFSGGGYGSVRWHTDEK